MTPISTASVAGLQDAAKVAHQEFSASHAKHAEAEKEFGKVAGLRSRLVKDLDDARNTLRDARRKAINACIEGAGFKEAAGRVAALENEAKLLDLSLREYHTYQYMDSQRATLAAKVETCDRRYQSERARLAAKVGEIEMSMSVVALNNHGHIEIQMGSVTRPYEELIARLYREADGAKEALQNHDVETRKLRDQVEGL